jgi:hypothetical protein
MTFLGLIKSMAIAAQLRGLLLCSGVAHSGTFGDRHFLFLALF